MKEQTKETDGKNGKDRREERRRRESVIKR